MNKNLWVAAPVSEMLDGLEIQALRSTLLPWIHFVTPFPR